VGILPELQSTGHMRGMPVRPQVNYFPQRRRGQHPMNGDVVRVEAHRSEVGIKTILLVVCPKSALRHAVRPRREKRNPVKLPCAAVPKCRDIRRRKVEQILATYLQRESSVANRGC